MVQEIKKMNRLPALTEYQECVIFAQYLFTLQRQKRIGLFTHIPEMHTMSHAQRTKNTMQGFNSGFPDYVILLKKGMLLIEMKRVRGSKTYPEQLEWQEALNKIGIPSYICYGYDEAKEIVDKYI